ncbi:CLUMA_CG018672, isoform A [Clunio marinus]|uniref:CLUMA_CG018672, isoform A n=1 Tax=Clunio marinus TaxID=568069 RepID=A0A1J1IYL0_9DIPT|nr:CLUMA_CG018672, isoform A [Clunio marinus]
MKVLLCLFFVAVILIDDANASLKFVPIEDQDQDPCSSLLAATSATYQNGYENLEHLEEQCTEELNGVSFSNDEEYQDFFSEFFINGCGNTVQESYFNTIEELADVTGFSYDEYTSSLQNGQRPGDLDCLNESDQNFLAAALQIDTKLRDIYESLEPQSSSDIDNLDVNYKSKSAIKNT